MEFSRDAEKLITAANKEMSIRIYCHCLLLCKLLHTFSFSYFTTCLYNVGPSVCAHVCRYCMRM